MALGARKRNRVFEVHIQDMVLRVSGLSEEMHEEVRAAGLQFWEQLQAYGIRNRSFRTSKRPVELPDDAPQMIREMAEAARAAGVGPSSTFQGALTDYVGRRLSRDSHEVLVSNGGDHFILTRRRSKLLVYPGDEHGNSALAVVIKPELGPHGIHTTMGRLHLVSDRTESVVVVARSCILADAAAAAAMSIVGRQERIAPALRHLKGLAGVHGAMIIRGDRIGVTGSLELAA